MPRLRHRRRWATSRLHRVFFPCSAAKALSPARATGVDTAARTPPTSSPPAAVLPAAGPTTLPPRSRATGSRWPPATATTNRHPTTRASGLRIRGRHARLELVMRMAAELPRLSQHRAVSDFAHLNRIHVPAPTLSVPITRYFAHLAFRYPPIPAPGEGIALHHEWMMIVEFVRFPSKIIRSR
ncbi:hypothetical protein GUJ93_ZPchr0002g25023 [Zizania palustris]|uniref:Uncharacterized protein n=1 Tax=Zizania palustris TaxID=103762 RepID=A0A8J5RW32_ZIZPA|nr:hypothetical protein GUJ93_ZPchr0002g25023 [Zizania palustris]